MSTHVEPIQMPHLHVASGHLDRIGRLSRVASPTFNQSQLLIGSRDVILSMAKRLDELEAKETQK